MTGFLKKACDEEKGFIFWNVKVASRKNKLGLRIIEEGFSRERRYICPDYVITFFEDTNTKEKQ